MMNRPSRLGRHFAAALTTAVAAQASAGVQYTPVTWVVPNNIDGLYINVETLATGSAGSGVAGWDINPYSATSLTWFNATGTGMMRYPGVTTGSAGSLVIGTSVGATGSFGSGAVTVGSAAGNWTLNSANYFGFRFIAADGLTHYGWGKFVIGASISGADRTITEIAWETTPGTAISVGDTGSGGGTYDPCGAGNQTVSSGNNTLGINSAAADLSLAGCLPGLTAYKANYYKFVPTETNTFDVSTCASGLDTVVAVLDGCAAGANVLACNGDFCGVSSQVTFSATAGSTYYVVVGASSSAGITGPVAMSITPWYSACASYNPTVAVGNNSVAVNQTTAGNLNVGSMTITKANYYKFTPSADGSWTFNTCTSGAATRMAVLSDCTPGASVIASNDDSCGQSSSVTATLTSGTPVYVVVGGEGSDIPSPIAIGIAGPPTPACVNAVAAAYGDNVFDTSVGNNGAQLAQNSTAGTTNGTINQSLWFAFTPTATGAFSFQTCGASGDTIMAIGTGCPTVGSRFDTIAYNDDAPCASGVTLRSFIDATNNGATGTFAGFPLTQDLVAGQTYYVCLGAYSATTVITGTLNISGPEGNLCPGDLDGDGSVGGADLGLLLGAWGACPGTPCLGDLNLDGEVNGADLGLLLGQWGACP